MREPAVDCSAGRTAIHAFQDFPQVYFLMTPRNLRQKRPLSLQHFSSMNMRAQHKSASCGLDFAILKFSQERLSLLSVKNATYLKSAE